MLKRNMNASGIFYAVGVVFFNCRRYACFSSTALLGNVVY